MANTMCRIRPIYRLLSTFEKRILFSSQNSRTYILASSPVNLFSNYKLGLSHEKAQTSTRWPAAFRFFSSDKKLSIEEISEKVLNVCKTFDKIPADKLTMESHFMEDLGLDSLDHVELIMNIEDDFNFEIPDADAEKLLRPKDIVAYIEQKEQARSQH